MLIGISVSASSPSTEVFCLLAVLWEKTPRRRKEMLLFVFVLFIPLSFFTISKIIFIFVALNFKTLKKKTTRLVKSVTVRTEFVRKETKINLLNLKEKYQGARDREKLPIKL